MAEGAASFCSPGLRQAKQFHNQPAQSHQQQFLVDLWEQVGKETDGRLAVTVHPQNNNIPGSDPAALEMLQAGELQFFTLMGGILGRKVPVAEIQGLPFAFTSHAQVHRANDGALGEYLGRECAAKGIYRFQYGLLENGFRQISMVDKPIRTADDLRGVKMRVPDGQMFRDVFTALVARGLVFNDADVASFRAKLGGGFYQRWKNEFGAAAWAILENEVGKLG